MGTTGEEVEGDAAAEALAEQVQLGAVYLGMRFEVVQGGQHVPLDSSIRWATRAIAITTKTSKDDWRYPR